MGTDLRISATLFAAGTMRLVLDGREAALSSRKALAILTYLALQPGRSESRERVAALLWSDSAGEQGRAALRQTLRRLKQDLGPAEDLIDADRSTLRLTQPVTVDILRAIETAARGAVPSMLAGEEADLERLFADVVDLDPDFNLWITVHRERLSAQLVSALEAALVAETRDPQRLALAEALTRAEPTHEGAARAAMDAHVALGDTAQAMRTYERLWQVLDEELDVEPSEKTQALYVAIKQGRAQRAAAPEAKPAEPDLLAPIAIVIEPVNQIQLPAEYAYFGGIFRHEMMSALSRFRDWLVIDGPHDGTAPPAYRVYNLRITIRGESGSLPISMMLVDRQDGRCVWSEHATANLDSMAMLLQTSVRNLAVALNVHLSNPRMQTVRQFENLTGRNYELWLQAQHLRSDWRPESEAKAEAIMREVIAATPNFAPALVTLAQSLNVRPINYPGKFRRRERIEESLALTSRAVNLNPLDSLTHLTRHWSHAIAGAHSAALSHLDLALDLNENDPWTIISAALGFAFAGERERARVLSDQARVFGMKFSRYALGFNAPALYMIGDFEGSIEAAEIAGDAIINIPAWKAASHMKLGDPERAAQSLGRFLDLALPAWLGKPNPTEMDAIDWFTGCFPIRSEAVKADLHAQLAAALAATKPRQD